MWWMSLSLRCHSTDWGIVPEMRFRQVQFRKWSRAIWIIQCLPFALPSNVACLATELVFPLQNDYLFLLSVCRLVEPIALALLLLPLLTWGLRVKTFAFITSSSSSLVWLVHAFHMFRRRRRRRRLRCHPLQSQHSNIQTFFFLAEQVRFAIRLVCWWRRQAWRFCLSFDSIAHLLLELP